jgi:hypothetical protein
VSVPRPVSRAHAQRRRGAAGAFALLTALLCLVAQVAGVAHLGLVAHVRCVEHDALVHTNTAGSHTQPAAPEHASTAQGIPGDVEGHGDDHCLAAALRREQVLASAPVAAAASAPVISPARPAVALAVTPPAPIALLSLAPKSSPPADRG